MRLWRPSGRALSSLSPPLSKPNPNLLLNHLLQVCSDSKAPSQGKQVHLQIIVHGSVRDHFLTTKLVQMYADCDDLGSARALFDKLPRPNVFAWTAILALYSRNAMFPECLRAYGEMQSKGVVPDNYVFPKVLRACAQLSSLEAGCRVHKDFIVSGSDFNVLVCNSLIDMYSKCGDAKRARRVFDMMAVREVASWNSMISGYAYNGLHGLAVELFNLMRLEGFVADSVTWNAVLDAYCRMGLCDVAWEIFDQIEEPNSITFTTLVCGYSRIERHESSLLVFEQMLSKGVIFPDVDSLSSVIAACRHLKALPKGRAIHAYGIKAHSSAEFYDSAGSALLTLYAKCGRYRDARHVFELMDENDVVSWNAMILGFVDLGCDHRALECFRKMKELNIQSDGVTLSTILPVCHLKSGKEIHAYIIKRSFESVTMVWNALIHMYSKCGCLGEAYSVFSNMKAKDLVSWNSMIGGFGMHGLGKSAIQLLRWMTETGISPNLMTFKCILSACSHSGLVDEGLQLFDSMIREYCLSPKMEHFACIVDLLARAGRLEDAVNFIKGMPVVADKSIWGMLLTASRDYQNVAVGKLAADHLFHLDPEHAGNYVALSNVYAKAGGWDDSVQVRKLMEVKGCVKPSGCSWIGGSG